MNRLLGMRSVMRYVVVFWAFYELLVIPFLYFQPRFYHPARDLKSTIVYCIFDGIFGILNTLVIFLFVDRFARTRRTRARELLTIAGFLLAAVFCMITFDSWQRTIFSPEKPDFSHAWLMTLRASFHDTLLVNAFLLGLGGTVRSWADEERARVTASRIDTAIARAELEALTAQLPPSLIAQALRQIRGVLARDTARARELIGLLASVMRESFSRDQVPSVPLRDELAAVQRFVTLQHALGLADVALQINVDPAIGRSPVPHLLLHTIVRDSLANGARTLAIDARRQNQRIAFRITTTGIGDDALQQLATRVQRVCGVLVEQAIVNGAASCAWSIT